MGDPGFVSGLIGVGITVALTEISERIKLAVHCKKELHKLEDYLKNVAPLNTAIQRYRTHLKLGQIVSHETQTLRPPAMNEWLKKLDSLVRQATEVAEQCCIRLPNYNVISRYRMSLRIREIVAGVEEHLKQAALIGITTTLASNEDLGRGLHRIEQKLDDLSTAATSSNYPTATQRFQPVNEPLIVGQHDVFSKLQKKLIDEGQGLTCLGVVAMGGAGKTLLLKTVFNSKEVQDSFKQDLVLWLTVSHNPSLSALACNLGRQIASQIKEHFNERGGLDDYVKPWIHENLRSKRFLLFLDDVWEKNSDGLLEALGVPVETVGNCRLVVSARDRRVLVKLGVKLDDTITLSGLSEKQSWELFSSHAFAYNNNQVPSVTVEVTAKRVCGECDGLPLAIKVIAATMAGVTEPVVWEVTLQMLQNADKLNPDVQTKLYNRLRLSYDALARYDPILQLCYLYIGAFKEDEDMYVEDLINLWIGEGLVTINRPDYDPLEIGRAQVNVLLDRCLIEGSVMDADGQVMVCSMHDVLHDLALQIAEEEENCLYRAGRNLQSFPEDDCAGRRRISLMENNFASIPESFQGDQVLSMLLSENKSLTHFPSRAMATMTWVRVLDLGGTSIQELPSSFGRMKQLVCLRLARLPIKKLPESITKLRKLQILDLSTCNKLERLPSGIDNLVSLRYLDLSQCQHLQSLPSGISKLTSLQYLRTEGCWQAWEPRIQTQSKLCFRAPERAACFGDLQTLTQLKWLGLEDARATIKHGTLGTMMEMRTLVLNLTKMTALPDDMTAMTKMKTLFIKCRDLIETPPRLSEFEHLGCLILSGCDKLQQISALHSLPRLRRLDMGGSYEMKDLPQEFGETGAFPALERFWVDQMYALERLPAVIEGAMPQLKILGVVVCPRVEMLSAGFFKLQHLQQIQVYSSPQVLQRMAEGGQDWEVVKQLQNGGVEIIREFGGHRRLTEITTRMGSKYWWDRFVKEMWMNFHI
ncbi:hypothetical protein SUGI_0175540 [Cryptomeria japonica]|uniref:probable disease resistance protein At1g61300 n=1 Tax=Cryptomeria japonica TaxID=3369 RepID=UPI0024089C83|nr:probable disease resistance protein At1g61300 [Cryptomeria japonica]GLJ11728.1 hypothetical protein SUGI_0175540 [Cryptomeria japonica]